MTDYLSHATTATGVPITECEVCGQRHPVTRAHCSRCRSWSAFQRSGLCLICSEIVAAHELAGKDLACWCPLSSPCHADVLLELANAGEPS